MSKKLNKRELLFVKAYLTDPNATQAAIAAGYSEKSARVTGCKLLTKPNIKEALEFGFKKVTEAYDVSAERILQELSRIAFVNMKDLATWNESGVRFKPSEEITEDNAAAIVEVSETVTQHGGTLKIRQHDKVRALELLGKYQKLFADRVEHSGPNGKPIEHKNVTEMSDDQLNAEIKAMMEKQTKGG